MGVNASWVVSMDVNVTITMTTMTQSKVKLFKVLAQLHGYLWHQRAGSRLNTRFYSSRGSVNLKPVYLQS